ncbi:MAG TPA: GNAT family N-acetyltransferase [Pirellulales bacterium]|nr:GNAT family N-acetyltransferase [Pirellulales bacterium]
MNRPYAHFAPWFERRTILHPHGSLDYRVAPGGTAEIVDVNVDGWRQRQGIGSELLAQMLEELPADVAVVYAFTKASNALAQAWYKNRGFQLTLVPAFYADGEGAYCCVLRKRR